MNISIKSYQTSIPAKAPAQEGLRSENTTKSTTENTNSSTAATVSISTFRLETTQNDGDSGTGIALIPIMPENTNLEDMLKQQQQGVQKLAQDKTKGIQNGQG